MNNNISVDENQLIEVRCEIGRKIKKFREKRGLSQELLAESMQISRSTISKIESGKFNCSIDYLNKFAVFLGFVVDLKEA